MGIEFGDCHLESAVQGARFQCWYDHRLGANQSKHSPKHSLSPQMWTRITGNPRLFHAIDYQWQCDQYESLKDEEGRQLSRCTFSRRKLMTTGNSSASEKTRKMRSSSNTLWAQTENGPPMCLFVSARQPSYALKSPPTVSTTFTEQMFLTNRSQSEQSGLRWAQGDLQLLGPHVNAINRQRHLN